MTRLLPKPLFAILATAAFISVSAAAMLTSSNKASAAQGDIVQVAVAAGQFTTLAAALEAADLVTTLQGEGPFTVFAPTDDAFAALPAGTVESLLKPENRDQLVSILTYHVVAGKVMASDVVNLSEAATVNGGDVAIEINDATVVAADVEASNGVIHVVNKVILP